MATGLSIATNLLSNSVQLNLDNNQKQLQNVVTQLSSGLRINTAADDPSGNAIATNLTSQYEAFNQASQNVQNANNAAQVALGALTQQTDILQRIRTLAVEWAASGTRVNGIAPGYFRTELTADLFADPNRAAWVLDRVPMGRLGDPADLAGAVTEVGAQVISIDEHRHVIEAAIPSHQATLIAAMDGGAYWRNVFTYLCKSSVPQAA